MKRLFRVNPVHTLNAWHFAKVLHVVSDYCQPIMAGSNGNEDVEIASSQALTGKSVTNISITLRPPFYNGQYGKRFFNLFRFFQMFFNSFTVKSTVSKFCNTCLRSKDLFSWGIGNVPIYTSTMVKILNPRICVENVTFHKALIIKIDITVKRLAIVTMLHHLIILFSFFSLRPNASHTKELRLSFFCRKFFLFFSHCCLCGHNQLVGQPLTVTLRERKSLQIGP